jgi:cytochrome c
MSFEANKIVGAILAAMILAMVSGMIANILVHPRPLEKPAYAVAGGEVTATATTSNAPKGPEPIAALMAKASVKAGEEKVKVCSTCHTFDKGGRNKIGPNLYGVVGDDIAHGRGGFDFSQALTTKGKGQKWTLANLNHWLFKPHEFAPGTKMTFVGLPRAEDRANVIAYLNSMSDHPMSMEALAATGEPAPKPAAAPAAKPAANGGKAAAGAEKAPAKAAGTSPPAKN